MTANIDDIQQLALSALKRQVDLLNTLGSKQELTDKQVATLCDVLRAITALRPKLRHPTIVVDDEEAGFAVEEEEIAAMHDTDLRAEIKKLEQSLIVTQ